MPAPVAAFAKIPLKALELQLDPGTSRSPDDVDITDYYPADPERHPVRMVTKTQDVHATPNINVNVAGTGGSFSGLGVDKRSETVRWDWISLEGVKDKWANDPTTLRWEYKDKNGVYYPSQLKLLIVVTKTVTKDHETWFPLQLILQCELLVDIHGHSIIPKLQRLIAKLQAPNNKGWCFNIRGAYQSDRAERALENALHSKESKQAPSDVGLYPAIPESLRVSTVTPSTS